MIGFPKKRIFGLIGAPRSGKDTVANYLQETRNFAPMAFADRIKEEFGITKGDFEAAKIAGNIDELRQELWNFSAKKKAEDPAYFIRLVMEEAVAKRESVVITDIRTEDEFKALFEYLPSNILARVYYIEKGFSMASLSDDVLDGSKLTYDFVRNAHMQGKVRNIFNDVTGVYGFYKKLDDYFFMEDIMDLLDTHDKVRSDNNLRSMVSTYVSHFEVRGR